MKMPNRRKQQIVFHCGFKPITCTDGFFNQATIKRGKELIYKLEDITETDLVITAACHPAYRESMPLKPYKQNCPFIMSYNVDKKLD